MTRGNPETATVGSNSGTHVGSALVAGFPSLAASLIAVIGRQKLQYALSFQQPIAPSAAARSVIANSRALSTMSRPWLSASERWTRFQMAAPLSCQKIDAAV